jgi:hypothetical protein
VVTGPKKHWCFATLTPLSLRELIKDLTNKISQGRIWDPLLRGGSPETLASGYDRDHGLAAVDMLFGLFELRTRGMKPGTVSI